jgi:hypothetical protein
MHQHPWRLVRALRVLLACLMLLLPAAPARATPAVTDTVLVVAYVAAVVDASSGVSVEAPAPAPVREPSPAVLDVLPLVPASRPAAADAGFVEDRWLLHCALLC